MSTQTSPFYLTRPDVLLRGEGIAALIAVCFVYQHKWPHGWVWFAWLFLVPDVSLLGFFWSKGKAAAAFYNLCHTEALPLVLGLWAWQRGWAAAGQGACIWLAHIAFDRCLGFGLKFPGNFKQTHIQRAVGLE